MQLHKEYDRSKRKLILLNHNTAVLLNLFYMDKDDEFETIVYDDIAADYAWHDVWKEAADEFVKQFRDNACPYFFKCLADRCNEEYQKWEKEHGEKYREIQAEFERRRNEILNESNSTE